VTLYVFYIEKEALKSFLADKIEKFIYSKNKRYLRRNKKKKAKASEKASEGEGVFRSEKRSHRLKYKIIGGEKHKMAEKAQKGSEGEKKATEGTEEKKTFTVEDIGEIVAKSGFKHDKKALETSVGLLKSLEDFMTIEGKGGETSEDRIRALVRDNVLSEAEGKKALAAAKNQKKPSGGVIYDEDSRKSINFSRTCVSHVVRLLSAIK